LGHVAQKNFFDSPWSLGPFNEKKNAPSEFFSTDEQMFGQHEKFQPEKETGLSRSLAFFFFYALADI
jgi:hypothetical protein